MTTSGRKSFAANNVPQRESTKSCDLLPRNVSIRSLLLLRFLCSVIESVLYYEFESIKILTITSAYFAFNYGPGISYARTRTELCVATIEPYSSSGHGIIAGRTSGEYKYTHPFPPSKCAVQKNPNYRRSGGERRTRFVPMQLQLVASEVWSNVPSLGRKNFPSWSVVGEPSTNHDSWRITASNE